MSLVILLLVILSAQVRVQLSTASAESSRSVAMNNAQLGLQIAFGQLQRTSGPDQRATAAADILSPSGYVGIEALPVARQWTGVWDSTQSRADGFLGWLVSAEDRTEVEGVNASAAPPTDRIELVGSGTVGSSAAAADLRVEAPIATVGGEAENGRYAFWVGDEGVKARFQGVLPSEEESTNARRRADFRLNQRNALEAYGDLLTNSIGDVFSAAMTDQPRSFTRSELLFQDNAGTEVPTADLLGETFFDFSPYPVGLLSDVKNGGWKKDLTWLFEEPDVTAELASIDANPSFPGSQISGEWPANASRSHWPAPPSWELLRNYYRMSADSPPFDARPQTGDEHGITPAITHFAISFIPGLDGVVEDNGTVLNLDDDYFNGRLRLYIDVRIAVWNPYDVEIDMPESDLEILWLQNNSAGITVESQMFFGNVSVDGNGTVSGGATHSGTSVSNFAGSGGAGFFDFNDRFYDNNDCDGLSFRFPATTLGPGEIVFFTIADSEDGSTYTGQNLLASVQNIGFPNTVWLQHSDLIDTGTSPLAGEDLVGQPFTHAKLDVANGGAIIHHVALRAAGTAGNDSSGAYGDYFGRYLTRKGSAGSFGQIINQDNDDLVEAVFGSPPVYDTPLAGPSIQTSHSLQENILMHTSNNGFRSSRWARNYNPRAPLMRKTEVDENNNPLTAGFWISDYDPYSGPFLNTITSGGKILVADRPTFNDSHAEHRVALYSFPKQGFKPISIADLRHVDAQPRSASNNYPIGGSLIDMRMADTSQTVRIPNNQNRYAPNVDGAYLLNDELWDSYYFSTVDGSLSQSDLEDGDRFPNSRIQLREGQSLSDFEDDPERFENGSARLEILGQFNINSTSKEAWKAVLASTNGLPYDPVNDSAGPDLEVAFSRLLTPSAEGSVRENSWMNYRILDEDDLETLAQEIVRGIQERGPFLTLGDFVNRSLGEPASGAGLQGVIAQAIDDSGVNLASDQLDLPSDENNPGDSNWSQVVDWYIEEAVLGSTSAGATRWLLQGDLLAKIGGMISVRSDTFLIRAYGEGPDTGLTNGEEKAFLEAVVQRIPEAVEPAGGNPFLVSGEFGRRYRIVSLRWLTEDEV